MPWVARIRKPRPVKSRPTVDPGRFVAIGQRQEHASLVAAPGDRPRAAPWRRRPRGRTPMPITSPVARISGPRIVSSPGNRFHGSTASLTATYPGCGVASGTSPAVTQLGEGLPHHHPGRHLGQRNTGGLGDERHGPGRPWVGLEDEHVIAPHRELDVEQTADPEPAGEPLGVFDDRGEGLRGRGSAAAPHRPSRRSGRRPPRRAPSRHR